MLYGHIEEEQVSSRSDVRSRIGRYHGYRADLDPAQGYS